MQEQKNMQDKTTLGISNTFCEFIEALVEEVVINGEPFDAQKKWLRKHSEAEGLNYDTVESNLNDLFEAIKELGEHESESVERFARNLAQNYYFSETEVNKLIKYAAEKRAQAERNRQQLIERNRIPVKIILISLGVISILDIIFLRWWCVIPLIFNAYMGILAHEKCGQGEIGYEKLVFKGGALVVILFFASFLHWWSLLLILPAIYFIIGKDEDIWDLN